MTFLEVEKLAKGIQNEVTKMQCLVNQINNRLIREVQVREVSVKKLEARFDLSEKKMDNIFDQLFKLLNEKGKSTVAMGLPSSSHTPLATTIDDERSTNGLRQRTTIDMDNSTNGVNPRAWVHKCNQFFYIHLMEESKKVNVASLYLEGKADSWFLEYQEDREFIEWNELTEQICK
ncbi:hypothetical protein IFM89_007272 [Coptis chinensis]|uniref:Ty3-gypsy retrotransposon protein n=1 Tax=Coptis chinensis TaxID=261450 RepID=A0A835MA81_9MAGN|nr:hypothetical protein IFM89_007272 [Coptis chinensis]